MKDWRNLAVVVACIVPFLGFWATGLTDLDEGFYGAVVAEMLRTGDWITPVYNGEPWFEKPVLTYWLAAPSVAAFGADFGPRLPSVVCTLLTVLVLFRFVRRHVDAETAQIVAVAYCGSLLVVAIGRMLMTDASFVLAMVVAFTTFYDSLLGDPRKRLWTAVALGFAVLAKGPVAVILFGSVAATTFWLQRDLRPKFRGQWLVGTVLFVAVVSLWYVPAYLANRDLFVQKFLVEQNIGRFTGGDLAHRVPWWSHPFYFPLVMGLAVLPWSIWAARSGWFQRAKNGFQVFLWTWCLVVVGFFTVSGSKLPHYALPAVAPFVVITVMVVARREGFAKSFWLKCAVAWNLIVLSIATPLFQVDYSNRFEELHAIARHLEGEGGFAFMYDVGREEGGTDIKLKLNESANPSFLFYMRGKGQITDDPAMIAKREGPVWIVVEQGALDAELSQLVMLTGRSLVPVDLPFETEKFEVWQTL